MVTNSLAGEAVFWFIFAPIVIATVYIVVRSLFRREDYLRRDDMEEPGQEHEPEVRDHDEAA